MLPRGCTKTKGCSNHRNPNAPTFTPRIPLRHPQICPLSTFGGRNQRFWLPPPHPWWGAAGGEGNGRAVPGPRSHDLSSPARCYIEVDIFLFNPTAAKSTNRSVWQRADLIFHPPGRCTCVCMAVRTRVPPVLAAHGSQNNSFLFFLLMQFFFFLSALKAAFLPAASMLKKGFVIPHGTGGIKTLRPGFERGRRSSPAPGTPWPAPAPRRIIGRLPGQTVLLPRENSTLQPPAGTRSSGKRRHSGAALLRITGAARSPGGGGVWVKVLPC